MDRYNAESVHKRVDYVQYIYKNTNLFPTNFESFVYPIAVYDRNGIIVRANRLFRRLADISADDIQHEKANIFDCLNNDNVVLMEAAHNAFDGNEKVYQNIDCALYTKSITAEKQLSNFPNAIFFPMYFDREGVRLSAVLLDENKTDEETEMIEQYDASDYITPGQVKKKPLPRWLTKKFTFAAACVAVFAIGSIAFTLSSKPPGTELQDNQVPLAALPRIQPDENAKPDEGAGQKDRIPDIGKITIPANTTSIQILLLNPADNDCNLVFEIAVDGETLYTSGLVEPGYCIEDITLAKGLPKGEYKAMLRIHAYAPEDFTHKSDATIEFILIAKEGVMP